MNRGLYISATSLIANQKKLDILSNNLANVNTTGFKKDISLVETFPEKLLSKINDRDTGLRVTGRNAITYETDGQVHTARTDNGYFVINTPNGNSYVKEVRFTVDEEGYLRTYYRDNREDLNTDYENFVANREGNPLQGQVGDIEELLQGNIYYPDSHVIGTMNAGVNFQKVVTDFTAGNIVETGGTYDLALDESGFFKVTGEDGNTYYTRDGSFSTNAEGALITASGELVQGIDGPIYIDGKEVLIRNDGSVIVDGNVVGFLDVVDIDNREFLRKVGDSLYEMAEGVESEEIPYEGEVIQGYLEGSNVNTIQEMVDMITLLREFESGQKIIRMQDEILQKASNEIGRV